jgi:predicted O-linked N-acetylglucosamine transferase (SPINDLY family)
MTPIIELHDRAQFHVVCYSSTASPDATTAQLKALADQWRDVAGLSDERVAQMIRDDRVDILIDLAGHTGDNRILTFARKPAPIQVSYLGYPNTTGLTAIDYRLTDAFADPPGMTEALSVEKLFRLTPTAWCYRPPPHVPKLSDLPLLVWATSPSRRSMPSPKSTPRRD